MCGRQQGAEGVEGSPIFHRTSFAGILITLSSVHLSAVALAKAEALPKAQTFLKNLALPNPDAGTTLYFRK